MQQTIGKVYFECRGEVSPSYELNLNSKEDYVDLIEFQVNTTYTRVIIIYISSSRI